MVGLLPKTLHDQCSDYCWNSTLVDPGLLAGYKVYFRICFWF